MVCPSIATFSLAIATVAANSFGGVNHYFLAAVESGQRQAIIRTLHNGGARVIRTFVRPEINDSEKGDSKATWPDVEAPLGNFANQASILDRYDDMLYDVYSQSGGRIKVLLSLHDANISPASQSRATSTVST